jgi:DNA polymerase III delta prime subunit
MRELIFTESYRPQTLDDVLLYERLRTSIGDGTMKQNWIFHGTKGTGKSSTAEIVTKQFNAHDVLYINASLHRGIDTIRDLVNEFAGTQSWSGGDAMKLVYFDEMDQLTPDAQKSLKATIEDNAENARFLGCTNEINKIIPEIRSRFLLLDFNHANDEEKKWMMREQAKRVHAVTKERGIAIQKEALMEFVKRNFPDLRSMLSKIQDWTDSGVTTINLEDINTINYTYRDVLAMLFQTPTPFENYKYLMTKYSMNTEAVLNCICDDLPSYTMDHHPEKEAKIPQAIIAVADYLNMTTNPNQAGVMLACVFKIQQIFNG